MESLSHFPLVEGYRNLLIDKDMEAEARYASPGKKFHRRAAVFLLLVVGGMVANSVGIGQAVRFVTVLSGPVLLIWFSEDLASHVSRSSGGWISEVKAPTALRAAAWFAFLCLTFLTWAKVKNGDVRDMFSPGPSPELRRDKPDR